MAKAIAVIKDEAIELAKGLNLTIEPTELEIQIRKTRAKSDIVVYYPKFNPTGIVTGCNARSALSFYLQIKAKAPTFNPEFELKAGKAKAKGIAKKS